MDLRLQLDLSLGRFAGVVRRLLEDPCLDSALEANIASLRLEGLFYETEESGEVPIENGIKYFRLIDMCLREFQNMIPRLNGEAWHVDLYREQMDGRKDLIGKMIHYSNSAYGYN